MAWIETVDDDHATSDLRRQYDAARKRAGKVFNIVKLSSLNPQVNRIFMQLYLALMHSTDSELSRRERELLATVVSRANHCEY